MGGLAPPQNVTQQPDIPNQPSGDGHPPNLGGLGMENLVMM